MKENTNADVDVRDAAVNQAGEYQKNSAPVTKLRVHNPDTDRTEKPADKSNDVPATEIADEEYKSIQAQINALKAKESEYLNALRKKIETASVDRIAEIDAALTTAKADCETAIATARKTLSDTQSTLFVERNELMKELSPETRKNISGKVYKPADVSSGNAGPSANSRVSSASNGDGGENYQAIARKYRDEMQYGKKQAIAEMTAHYQTTTQYSEDKCKRRATQTINHVYSVLDPTDPRRNEQ